MEGQKLMHRIEGERAKDETLRMGEPNPTFRASDEFRQVSIKVKDKISRCIFCRLGVKLHRIVIRIRDKACGSLAQVWHIIRVR